MAGTLNPAYCPGCQGWCDGSTQECTLASYYANPANLKPGPGLRAYPASWYEDAVVPPTVRSPAVCECGSGSNTRSGAHSHWCRLWVAP